MRAKDYIALNPQDALDFDVRDGETVRIISRWGEVKGIAKITVSSPPGLIVMDFLEEKILQLIKPALDPVARTPESKICAVRIESLKESRDE